MRAKDHRMLLDPSDVSADFKYWAFINYSHLDRRWGEWLHRQLETYRVPKNLVGKPSIVRAPVRAPGWGLFFVVSAIVVGVLGLLWASGIDIRAKDCDAASQSSGRLLRYVVAPM